MTSTSLEIPRRCIAVLTIIQELLDKLGEDRHFCFICRDKFEPANVLAIVGRCGQFHHLDCLSQWLNTPLFGQSPDADTPPKPKACLLCTARWHPRTFNYYFPRERIRNQIKHMADDRGVTYIPAGIPPKGSSLLHAVTHYGRAGAAVIVGELIGQRPVDEDELTRFLAGGAYDPRNRVPAD